MSNKPVTDGLKKVLAETYGLMLKTQNYHWNVEGPNFSSLHLLFEGQYGDLFAAVDALAERVRALGEKAPGSYSEFKKLSSTPEANSSFDANQMLADLAESNLRLSNQLAKTIAVADKAGDDSTVDLLTQRVGVHDKAAWMLKASLPKDARVKLAV